MNLIEEIVAKSTANEYIRKNFAGKFALLKVRYNEAVKPFRHDRYASVLDTPWKQLEFIHAFFQKERKHVWFASRDNHLRGIVVGLKHKRAACTVFFNTYQPAFAVAEYKLCLREHNIGTPLGRAVYILESNIKAERRQFLYDENGLFLGLEAEQVCAKGGNYWVPHQAAYIMTTEKQRHGIYTGNLQPILTDADEYGVYDGWKCVIRKDTLWYLADYHKGLLLPTGFDEVRFYQDKYYSHTEIEYFLLRKARGYSLFLCKQNRLYNPSGWTDCRAENGFDYIYFQKENQWFRLELYQLTSTPTKHLVFEQRIVP